MTAPLPAIRFDHSAFQDLAHEGCDKALSWFREAAAEVVWSDAAMEKNPVTFVEVQALMAGTTVDGHTVSDVEQVLRLVESQKQLHDAVATEEFSLTAGQAKALNKTIATGEALEAGVFRGEGSVQADISVSLADGTSYQPPATTPGAENLKALHASIIEESNTIDHPVARAFFYHAHAIVAQFFFDGNKRTARHMLNGELMRHGYAPLVINGTQVQEYHAALLNLFADLDARPLSQLMAGSTLTPGLRAK